jgi:hypothetical protein
MATIHLAHLFAARAAEARKDLAADVVKGRQ